MEIHEHFIAYLKEIFFFSFLNSNISNEEIVSINFRLLKNAILVVIENGS